MDGNQVDEEDIASPGGHLQREREREGERERERGREREREREREEVNVVWSQKEFN